MSSPLTRTSTSSEPAGGSIFDRMVCPATSTAARPPPRHDPAAVDVLYSHERGDGTPEPDQDGGEDPVLHLPQYGPDRLEQAHALGDDRMAHLPLDGAHGRNGEVRDEGDDQGRLGHDHAPRREEEPQEPERAVSREEEEGHESDDHRGHRVEGREGVDHRLLAVEFPEVDERSERERDKGREEGGREGDVRASGS